MNKQLDASTAELVQLLTRYGYSVQHPVDAEIGETQARIAIDGGRYVLVNRNEQGGFVMQYEPRDTPAPEALSYYDMLNVSIALDHEYEREHKLWNEAIGVIPENAGKHADRLNTISTLRQKVNRILQAERHKQRLDEAAELAKSAEKSV